MSRLSCLLLLASQSLAQVPDSHGRAIERGVDWLLSTQALDGSWRGYSPKHPTGVTALCVYTLLKCGLPADHQAVERGIAFVRSSPLERTYAVAAALMACQALPARERPKPLVKRLTRQLVSSLQQTGWGYPRNASGTDPVYADTSNTQYALLGLRAAAAMGQRIPSKTWRDAADALIRRQDRYGGFGYQRSDRPTGAMTVAGFASMVICADALPRRDGIQGKLRTGCRRAAQWLSKNWSMTTHIAKPAPTKDTDRWLLYYLYGVERLAAFLEQDRIGKHDWYAEGAPGIVDSQKKDGNWQLAMSEVDTCFALLFLTRGSRRTGLAPRVRAERAAASKSPFVIGSDGGHPVQAWVRKPGAEMRRLLDSGHSPTQITWLVDGKPVSTSAIDDAHPLEKQTLTWTAKVNGRRLLSASLRLMTPDGETEDITSNEVLLKVDHVPPAGSAAIIADLGNDLLRGRSVQVDASSHSKWTRPEHLVDGTHARRWMSAPDDDTPWITLQLDQPVRAKRLTWVSATATRRPADHLSRAKDVEISVGAGKPRRVTLEDSVTTKQSIPLPSRAVSKIRIRVLTRYPGKTAAIGIAELELRKR